MEKISFIFRITIEFPTSISLTFAVTLSIISNISPRYLRKEKYCNTKIFNTNYYIYNFFHYQQGLTYTIHGVFILTDFIDSNILLSSNISFSNLINSIRLLYVCTEYLEEDIFSAIHT